MVSPREFRGIKPALTTAERIAAAGRFNWIEHYPGFWLPATWSLDNDRFPNYTDPDFLDKAGGEMVGSVEGEDGKEITRRPRVLGVDPRDVLRLRGLTQPDKRAWGAWLGGFANDRPLKRGWPDLEHIADRTYSTARFKYLTPIWRQKIIALMTALDDVEDQLSTILWIVGWVAKKWIPKPLLGGLDKVKKVNDSLDCAGKALGGVGVGRGGKSDYMECIAAKQRRARAAIAQKKGLLAWLRSNWGQLLEAAQASGTWTDVGIQLGPIMAVVEDGWWGGMNSAATGYSELIDLVIPGYREFDLMVGREVPKWLDKNFFQPLKAVDWESIESDPFQF